MCFIKYSVDIKKLAVQKSLDGLPLNVINHQLHRRISQDSLDRWKALYRETHSVTQDPATYEKRGRPLFFTSDELSVMLDLVTHTPSLFLDEVQRRMLDLTGKKAPLSVIHHDLHSRLGLTLLKTRRVHPLQSDTDRAAYISRVSGIPPEFLVFIGKHSVHHAPSIYLRHSDMSKSSLDESGVVGKDIFRKYSWAPKGARTAREVQMRDTDHWTILPAVYKGGMLAGVVHKGPVERLHVEMFLKRNLVRLVC